MLTAVDNLLNKLTMYRVLVYGLSLLLIVAEVLALTNTISVSPLGIIVSLGVLTVVGYVVNNGLAWWLKVPINFESGLITILILTCILPPPVTVQRTLLIALTGAIAMASKFILFYRGRNLFNPAAFGAFVVSVTGLLPVTWWVGVPQLAAFTGLLGLAVLRKQRKFSLFASFALSSLVMLLFVSALRGSYEVATIVKDAFLSWPLIFLGTIMLTEPSTLPARYMHQLQYGLLVGLIFTCQLHWWQLSSTPQAALLVGNLFAILAGSSWAWRLRLKYKEEIAPNIFELAFEAPKNLRFTPGQYGEWTLTHKGIDGRGNRRTFSLASAPGAPEVKIGIKRYEPSSSFKQALLAMEPGQSIRLAHVAGDFVMPADRSQSLVFVAGGIGITPFISMLDALVQNGEQRSVDLYYLANSQQEFAFKDSLKAAQNLGVKLHLVVGQLSEEQIKAMAAPANHIYISGPPPMVRNYRKMLRQAGAQHIHTDFFAGY